MCLLSVSLPQECDDSGGVVSQHHQKMFYRPVNICYLCTIFEQKEMSDFNLKGHAAMFGANTMWGVMAPVAKMVLAAGVVTPLLMVGFRMAGAAILFWVASLFTTREHVPAADLLRLAGAAMLGVLFNQGCYVFGVGFTSPGDASIITTTMPLWVMVLAALFLKEPITVKKAGGKLLGGSGALILVLGSAGVGIGGDNPVLGDVLVLCAQLSFALYLTLYRNFIRKYSIYTLMKWMFTFASLPLLVLSAPSFADLLRSGMTVRDMAGVGYVVVVGTFLAYICMMYGQKQLRPTIVGMYNYVQPVTATAVGIILGLDSVTPAKCIAVALIFSGVWLVTRSKAAAPTESSAGEVSGRGQK